MNNLERIKRIVADGLQIDQLDHELADAIYTIIDLSDDFTNASPHATDVANDLVANQSFMDALFKALPNSNLLAEIRQEQTNKNNSLLEKFKSEQARITELINHSQSIDELNQVGELIMAYDWSQFAEISTNPVESIEQLYTERFNQFQRITQEKGTDIAPDRIYLKDLKMLGIDYSASYPNTIECFGRKYRRPSFLGVSFVNYWYLTE